MRSTPAPETSPRLFRLFSQYARWYLRRHVHSVSVARGPMPANLDGWPVLVCLNHPSWWDPLLAITLACEFFPERRHFGPIDSAALAKYRFFERLGFFGIDPATVTGAARFLRMGGAILRDPASALWVTAQGTFVDARVRPTRLRSGVGHLVRSLDRVAVLPLALEYTLWEERTHEALVRWGEPLRVDYGASRTAAEWTAEISARLEQTQDALAAASIARHRDAFEVLLHGGAGVGGIYDLWRRSRARLRGEPFVGAHGIGST